MHEVKECTRLLQYSAAPLNDSLSSSRIETLKRCRRLLYLSHFFNQFSEKSWQFCLILFLAALSNYHSLLLVSTYGFVSSAFVCYFGSAAGRFVDKTNRLTVARKLIGLENVAVLLATGCCYILLSGPENDANDIETSSSARLQGIPTDLKSIVLLVCIHFLGAAAKVLDTGFLVAVERDWVVVMSKSAGQENDSENNKLQKQKEWLSTTNVTMKQIDLACEVVAPTFAGIFVAMFQDENTRNQGHDLAGATLLVGILNVVALIVEYSICTIIYDEIPSLAVKRATAVAQTCPNASESPSAGDESFERMHQSKCFYAMPDGLQVYLSQDIRWAGISLSLLYLNVLSFGGIMTAYLVWKGMRLDVVGFWRGVSSANGLLGTCVYHFLSRRSSLVNTGMFSCAFQFLCLSLSYTSLFVNDLGAALTMLLTGVIASRVGLWVFDISVTQLFQLHVQEEMRGLVGGVQQSMNSFFFMLSFTLGIFIPDPRHFHYYVSIGYASVGLAVVCYSVGVFGRKQVMPTVT